VSEGKNSSIILKFLFVLRKSANFFVGSTPVYEWKFNVEAAVAPRPVPAPISSKLVILGFKLVFLIKLNKILFVTQLCNGSLGAHNDLCKYSS
jgi:hypothetical protein